MGLNKDLRRITERYEEERRKIGEDYFNRINDEWAEREEQDRERRGRRERLEEKKQHALNHLYCLQEKYRAKNRKYHLFEAFDNLVNSEEYYLFNTDVTCALIKIKDEQGIESVNLTIKGYRETKEKIGVSTRFNHYWWEILYLIYEGIRFDSDDIDFFIGVLYKEFGIEDDNLDKDDTIFGFLKHLYSFLGKKVTLYWGEEFYEDYMEKKVEDRISSIENEMTFVDDDNEFYREMNKNYLLGIRDNILNNGTEPFITPKRYVWEQPVEENTVEENIEEKESENLVNVSDDTIKRQPQKNKTEDKPAKEKKEKKSIFPTTSPLQKLSEKMRGKTNTLSDSLSNSFETLTKKISETTEDLANATSVEEVKKKMKKGLKGWLNKLSDKLDD